ncbi:MAG TPA: hypothetical protein PK082_08035 [Phycisphaerae bacterium]|nr:hypothetical protein [Phycisphaerae bacterium]
MAKEVTTFDVLERVRERLELGFADDALDLITRTGKSGSDLDNARGVCLLRLGRPEQAARVFRELVFPKGSMWVPPETPVVYQANYVTAMLLTHNLEAAMTILGQIHDSHPAVERVRAGVRKWKRSLGLLRRAAMLVGVHPGKPVTLEAPLGDL